MKRLLDNQVLRKLNILSELALTLEPTNIHDIAKTLEISTRTLLSTIEEINQDAELFQQLVHIKRCSRSELQLEVASNFSVLYFKLRYLKESILYQILDDTFKGTLKNQDMQTIIDTYHTSTTVLYRKLLKIKELLNDFGLELNSLCNSSIEGDEKQIRFFFFQFYWHSTQMFEWPFTQELKDLCLSLYDKIFIKQFETKTPIMKEKIILWLAINIIRIQSGYKISPEETQEMNQFLHSNINYMMFKKRISEQLADIFYMTSVKFEECDYILFYCMLICDKNYSNDNEFSFVTLTGKERTIFEEVTLLFLNKLPDYLGRSLNDKEYYKLYKNLLKVNMQAAFFIQTGLFSVLDERFDYFTSSYYDSLTYFDTFYQELYPDTEEFQIFRNNPNLYQKYVLLLIDSLDITTFYPEIKIMLLISESENIESLYRKKIQSLTQSSIYFVNEVTEDVDLLISYASFDLKTVKNYFMINIPATSWDWNRLQLELSRIQNAKRPKLTYA